VNPPVGFRRSDTCSDRSKGSRATQECTNHFPRHLYPHEKANVKKLLPKVVPVWPGVNKIEALVDFGNQILHKCGLRNTARAERYGLWSCSYFDIKRWFQ
jgi:hypothetical protein